MAVIITLSAPMLLGITALSVDVGYWYQNQTALQSAADAAALAAAMNDARLDQTSDATKASAALPYAQAAADNATNSQFGFVAGAAGTALTLNTNIGSPSTTGNVTATTTTYTATAKSPRPGFFSPVYGFLSGSQYASATASYISKTTSTAGGCLVALGTSGTDISASGGATITATGCGIVSDSTTACSGSGKSVTGSIALNPSGKIVAPSISMASGAPDVCGDGAGGSSVSPPAGTASVAYSSSAESDPYANLRNAGLPEWPSMPTAPALSSTFNSTTNSPCGLTSASNTQAIILAPCNYPNGISYGGGDSLELTAGDHSQATDNVYAVANGIDFTSGLTGGGKIDDYLATNQTSLVPVTVYATGKTSTKQGVTSVSGFALSFEDPTESVLPLSTGTSSSLPGGIFYLNGGMQSDGSNTALSIGQGTFLTSANTGGGTAGASSGDGAMYLQEGTTTFAGGTFYFDGGLNISGSAQVTFGPGIYYFRNGDFTDTGSGALTANGATFVFENGSSFQWTGGGKLNLSAPVPNSATAPTNCVLPFSSAGTTGPAYPLSNHMLNNTAVTPDATGAVTAGTVNATNSTTTGIPANPFPWDGTQGQGICGVLIYQVSPNGDAITAGATDYLTGIIYTPLASLTISGGTSTSIQASTASGASGTLALVAQSINLSGSGSLAISAGSAGGSQIGLSSKTTTQVLLTQ
ncbi:MAG TPA: pilus assembly protein TadG-related protein [Acidocella sp.]|uniref:pilus assembly protein TadG-related protein n=1 Tax=Acidocella sp. TaxID=50710 RepID=UPI002CF550AA|nr:pilus assembly protein TadG-related protein [Acidocella sp.]HVE20917.1 pilus assembly protein TadG-related protein [Acidocella sp.]